MASVNQTISMRIVRAALDAEPDIPALTLARRLFMQNPGVWPSVDGCRTAIRGAIGTRGKGIGAPVATHARPPRKAGEDWTKFLPEEKRTIKIPWEPVHIKGAHRILALYDIHVPFHDTRSLTLAMNYGIDNGATMIALMGDAMDVCALSRFEKDPDMRDFPGEIRAGRALLKSVRSAFPDARIIWKWGNHEERYQFRLRAYPEFYGVDDWQWESVFRYKDQDVQHVGDKRPIVVGKGLNLIHGHEFGGGISAPVNPARTYFLKAGVHVIGGHFHQTSQHSAKNLEQNVVSAWSSGCLCEEHPDYRPINNWSQGFVFIDVNKSGAFRVENKRIIDGSIW